MTCGLLVRMLRPIVDDDAEAVVALQVEVDDALVRSPRSWLHWRRSRPADLRALEVAIEEDGGLVALGAAGLNTTTTTEGAAWLTIAVTASHRGRGLGTTLHERLLDHLGEIGATRVSAFTRFGEEPERWLLARGWARQLAGPLIALDPRGVPPPSPPDGFRCAAMAELRKPRAIYELTGVAIADEPRPERIDNYRYEDWRRQWEDPDLDRDASTVVLDGEQPVAFTYLNVVGDRAHHNGTGTLPDYRRRGLATAAKRHALRAAAAKGITRVTTSSAEENAAMRAINRKLGFEPIGEHVIYGRAV